MNSFDTRIKNLLRDNNIPMKKVENILGVTSGHFYKVIKGERDANKAIVAFLSELTATSEAETQESLQRAKAIYHSEKSLAENNGWTLFRQRPLNSIGAAMAVVIGAALFLATYLSSVENNYSHHYKKRPEKFDTAVPGDSISFVADVTMPDGERVEVNTTFEKIWRIKNTGDVTWTNRTLRRITPRTPELCDSIGSINIPLTKPGQVIDLSVDFKTPLVPGSCKIYWKMFDQDGSLSFPDAHPLFVLVNIVANK